MFFKFKMSEIGSIIFETIYRNVCINHTQNSPWTEPTV